MGYLVKKDQLTKICVDRDEDSILNGANSKSARSPGSSMHSVAEDAWSLPSQAETASSNVPTIPRANSSKRNFVMGMFFIRQA